MDITYREATLHDIDLLANTRVSLIDEDSSLSEGEKIVIYESNKTYMNQAMQNGSFFALMAFDENSFAGTGSVCFYAVMPGKKLPDGKNAYIQNVYVSPSYRRMGVGQKIISMLVAEANERGHTRITLHATKMGSALFGNCGFRDIDIGLSEMVYVCPEQK